MYRHGHTHSVSVYTAVWTAIIQPGCTIHEYRFSPAVRAPLHTAMACRSADICHMLLAMPIQCYVAKASVIGFRVVLLLYVVWMGGGIYWSSRHSANPADPTPVRAAALPAHS